MDNSGLYQKIKHLSDPKKSAYIEVVAYPTGDMEYKYLNDDKTELFSVYSLYITKNLSISTSTINSDELSNDITFWAPFSKISISNGYNVNSPNKKIFYSTHTYLNVNGQMYYTNLSIRKDGSVSFAQYIKIN